MSMFGELKRPVYHIAYFCQKTMHENGLKMALGFLAKSKNILT